jgi:hypothetical protein
MIPDGMGGVLLYNGAGVGLLFSERLSILSCFWERRRGKRREEVGVAERVMCGYCV